MPSFILLERGGIMSIHSHKGQILPIINQIIPIEKSTFFHASYDNTLNAFNQGEIIEPIGSTKSAGFNADGSSVLLPVGKGINPTTSSIEINATVKLKSLASQIVLSGMRPTTTSRFYFGVSDSKWDLGINNTAFDGSGTVPATTGKWVDLKFTASNGTASLYIDGVLSKSRTYGSFETGELYVGKNAGFNDYKGDFYLSNLSIEIDGELVAEYDAINIDTPVWRDSSGHSNDAVIDGTVTPHYGPTVATLTEGKYLGGVRVEPGTVNILSNPDFLEKTIRYFSWGGGGKHYFNNSTVVLDTSVSTTVYEMITSPAIPSATSGSWTFSMRCRSLSKNDIIVSSYLGVSYKAVGVAPKSGEWVTLSYTYTQGEYTANPTQYTYISPERVLEIDWIQLENRDYATSFVNGTREVGSLQYPVDIIKGRKKFTVGMWFKIPKINTVSTDNLGVNGSWHNPIFEITPKISRGNKGFAIYISPDTSAYNRTVCFRGTSEVASTKSITNDTWHHMIATYDNGTTKVYLDGELALTATEQPIIYESDTVIRIGGGYHGIPNTVIDEVRIDSRIISEEEILAWSQSGIHYNYLNYSILAD